MIHLQTPLLEPGLGHWPRCKSLGSLGYLVGPSMGQRVRESLEGEKKGPRSTWFGWVRQSAQMVLPPWLVQGLKGNRKFQCFSTVLAEDALPR